MTILDIQRAFNRVVGGSASNLVAWLQRFSQGGGGSTDSLITTITITPEQQETLIQEGVVEFPHEKVTTPLLRIVTSTNSTTFLELYSGVYGNLDVTGPTGKVDTITHSFATFEDGNVVIGHEDLDII